ncbi:MAG: DUF3237 domain-containing protein [Hyphomicrobiaceae bacterium]
MTGVGEGAAPELHTRYLGELRIEVSGTLWLGDGPLGLRRLDRLEAGHFQGPHVKARIVAGGLDTLLKGQDGAFRPDVRLVLELDDGAPLLIRYQGVRHGPAEVMERLARGEAVASSQYYLRTALTFETASPGYDWLNRIVAVGVGRRERDAAVYDVFEVL